MNLHWWKYQNFDHTVQWTSSWISTNAFKGTNTREPTTAPRRLTVSFRRLNQITPCLPEKGWLGAVSSLQTQAVGFFFLSPFLESRNHLTLLSLPSFVPSRFSLLFASLNALSFQPNYVLFFSYKKNVNLFVLSASSPSFTKANPFLVFDGFLYSQNFGHLHVVPAGL